MARLILEIFHGPRSPKQYQVFDEGLVRVGRGFANDVILSDPYVAAEHVIIKNEEGGWQVEDLGSQNGIFDPKQKRVVRKTFLTSGEEFIIGKTRFKILSMDQPVAYEKRLIQKSRFIKYLNMPLIKWGMIVGMVLLYAVEAYFASERDLSFGKLISSGIGIFVPTLLWAGLFAFIGAIIKHKARFFLQLALSSLFMILLIPAGNIASYLGFAASQGIVEIGLFIIFLCVLFAYFLVRNLALATHIATRKLIVASIVITILILSVGGLLTFAFKDEFSSRPNYYATLKPPFAKLSPSRSLEVFLAEGEEVFNFRPAR